MLGMRLRKNVDMERAKLVAEYITNSAKYTLETFLKEKHLMDDANVQGDNILITCPWHIDYSPSMSVNLIKNMYKCFSCGDNGGYFKFILTYKKVVQGTVMNYYKLLEEFLKDDQDMQLAVGFATIYKSDNLTSILEVQRRQFKASAVSYMPENYIELANILKKDKTKSVTDYIFMISLMQKDIAVKDIYNAIYTGTSANDKNNELDLDVCKLL